MKLIVLHISLWLALPVLLQSVVRGQSIGAETVALVTRSPSLIQPATVDLSDTLWAKRRLFTTKVYKKGEQLSNEAVINLLQDTRRAQKLFRLGNILKPVASVLAVSGIALGYLGIKGTEKTAMIRGIGTKTNPNVPDIEVAYTSRSLPKLLGGLGLFVGSMCVLELSNQLTAKSVVLYNTKSVSQKSISQVMTINAGLTSSGNVGLEAHF